MSAVYILTCQHPPDDSRVTHRLGRSLVEQGHQVIWIGPRRALTSPDYGITFRYFPATATRAGRPLNARRLRAVASRLPPPDVYLAVQPDAAAVACDLARRRGGRVIFDSQEIYHDESLLRWVPRALKRPAGFVVRRVIQAICRRCDLIVAPGTTRLEPYLEPGRPSLIVRHCVPRGLAPAAVAGAFPPGREGLTLLHGKATMGHGTGAVLAAVARLKQQHGVPCRVTMFQLRADMARFEETPVARLARELDVRECIDLREAVPFEELFPIMAASDVGLIAYGRAFGIRCVPNRVFEYLSMGLPVVVPAYALEMQPLLERYGCGRACDMEQPEALAAELLWLWQHRNEARAMGLRGRAAFERELNWETEFAPLAEWIRSAVGK